MNNITDIKSAQLESSEKNIDRLTTAVFSHTNEGFIGAVPQFAKEYKQHLSLISMLMQFVSSSLMNRPSKVMPTRKTELRIYDSCCQEQSPSLLHALLGKVDCDLVFWSMCNSCTVDDLKYSPEGEQADGTYIITDLKSDYDSVHSLACSTKIERIGHRWITGLDRSAVMISSEL